LTKSFNMRYFAFFLTCALFFEGHSQVLIPANSRADFGIIQKDIKSNKGLASDLIKERFAVYTWDGISYVACLGKVNNAYSRNSLRQMGIIVGAKVNDIVSLKIPVDQLSFMDNIPGISILEIAGKIKPNLDKAVHDIGADSVHMGYNLPQGYTGKNVLIGITDWGFDYSSPMFFDTLLQNTRILAAWDQYKTSGPAPVGFNYGTEYSSWPEFESTGSDTANIYSYATHGTHVAGIAGGSGAGTVYRGVAFDSQFLFATFLVDESAVLDAWEWMYQKSLSESKRLVVNMSWGLYHLGTLDGNSLLSQAIDGYSSLGVLFANSGGNNGNVNFHIKKQFNNDSIRSRIEFYSFSANANMWGQSIHAWGEQGNSFASGIEVFNTSGSTLLVASPMYSTLTTTSYVDTFLVAGADTIWYNIAADQAHPINNRPQMRFRVKNTNTGLRVVLKSQAATGTVHYWNVTELSNDVGNWGMPFSTFTSGTINGDHFYGISEPSCTNSLISVAAYSPKYYTPGGSPVGGGIASFSSIGPRYDEVIKPDIAAPGVAICSSISSYTDASYSSQTAVSFNGRNYPFAKFSGTSMAAPMVTGVIALILEANPYLSAQQIKDIIIQTAREDANTGIIPITGSTQWGWGKINAYHALQLALITVGTEKIDYEMEWSVYPNPTSNEIHFTIIDELPETGHIIDSMGKIQERKINDAKMNVSDLTPGRYWIRIEVNGRIEQESFVKQ
jgi:minor extracellular serine protease Vpr